MKIMKFKSATLQHLLRFVHILVLGIVTITCQEEVKEWVPKTNEMVITDYVYSEPELFSEFGAVLEYTGIENFLRVRGPYTLLLPTDAAMRDYYTRMNVTTYTDLEMQVLSDMVYNHIFNGEITAGSIGLGTLPFENGLGDYVASDLPGSDILLNKKAKIIKRDILAANGIVHHIDYVLEPITKSVYDILAEYPGYSIFRQGLERAGLVDTLKILTFPYGNITARTNFTLLAVADTLYNREGIFTIEDLINAYSTEGELTDPNNGFYQYMEYHCLSGTHYFSDFSLDAAGGTYYIISNDNYLNIKVEEDYKINKTDTSYIGFYYDLSNIPAKNGTIHTINTQLPNTETKLEQITHQVTDYFDLHQGSYYQNNYQRFYDGENTFEYIKWDGEYLMYYFKPEPLYDDDALNLNGHFWVQITTPKIRKGKYTLSTFMFYGPNAITAWYVDGEYLGQVDPNDGSWGQIESPLPVGELDFTETKRHIIRLETVVPGQLFWDYVRFTPIP